MLWIMAVVVILWLLVIAGIVLLVVWLANRSRSHVQSPLDVLARRYAQGEISREEYERMKREISHEGG